MKNLKGNLVFFEMNEVQSTKAELERLGFGKYVPRNDYKTALIKALKEYKKVEDDDKIYRRFLDQKGEVSFTIFAERIEGDVLSLDREITIKLDKLTGIVTCDAGPDLQGEFTKIEALFSKHQGTINADQLRALVIKALRDEAHSISMKKQGGLYFIDQRFTAELAHIQALLESFRDSAHLRQIPIYDDKSSLEAISDASHDELFNEIETLITTTDKAFKANEMTERKLEGRKADALVILEKIELHKNNLASAYETVAAKLAKVKDALNSVTSKVETGIADSNDFMSLLAKL